MLEILNSSAKSRLKAGRKSINELLDFISEKPDAAVLPLLFRMKTLNILKKLLIKQNIFSV